MNQATNKPTSEASELQASWGHSTNVPEQFIEAMREGLEATAVQETLANGMNVMGGAAALPDHIKVHDLEQYLPLRRRARGCMATKHIAPFAQYTQAHAEPGATVFIDTTRMRATALLNLGTPNEPGHADNKAELVPDPTAAYSALTKLAGSPVSQQVLSEFIEDWGGLADMKFFNNEGEIVKGKAMAAIRRITIENVRKHESEEQQLSANRSTFESVSASSHEPIPTLIYFTAQPYADLSERTFVLRLSIITGERAPSLVLRLQHAEKHQEDMGNELAGLVTTAMQGATPVLLGSYSPSK